ncbi:hypothetical protein CC79DRAFT_1159384 [Sarocladium strictum]
MADVQVFPISREADIRTAADIAIACFGHQTADNFYRIMNPGWDTADGVIAHADRAVARFHGTTTNEAGEPNTLFLAATVQSPDNPSERIIVGHAIWVQLSAVDGHGDKPVENLGEAVDLELLFPGDEKTQRLCVQAERGLHACRKQTVKDKAGDAQPACFVLDMCVVHPDFQRKGIAQKLVQWGLDEAERRGGLEALTEASVMGYGAYKKLGFQKVCEVDFMMDEEFSDYPMPPNVFMRTASKHGVAQ